MRNNVVARIFPGKLRASSANHDLNSHANLSYVWAILYGCILTLAFAPFEQIVGLIAAFCGLLYLTEANLIIYSGTSQIVRFPNNIKRVFVLGYCFGFGHFSSSLYWLAYPLMLDLSRYWMLVPLALLLAPVILALFSGLSLYCAYISVKILAEKTKNPINISQFRLYLTLFLSLYWSIYELIRGYMILPFPWNFLGYTAGFSIYFLQSLCIFGVSGLSSLLLLLAATPYVRSQNYSIFALSITILLGYYGYDRINAFDQQFQNSPRSRHIQQQLSDRNLYEATPLGTGQNLLELVMVQPNKPPKILRNEAELMDDLQHIMEMTHNAYSKLLANNSVAGQALPTLVLWPESAIPLLIDIKQDSLHFLSHMLTGNHWLITGIDRVKSTPNTQQLFYNSLIALRNGRVVASYDKRELVPFGEYMPLYNILRTLLPVIVDNEGFSPGTNVGLTSIAPHSTGATNEENTDKNEDILKFAPYICSEIIFPSWFLDNRKQNTSFIVNITNDVWFGNSSGPYQHLAIARARAVEMGLPLFRVANNGISAVIDKFGRFIYRSDLNKSEIHTGRYVF